METLFSTDYAEIQLQPNYLLVIWKKYADDDDFRICIEKQVEFAEQHNKYKLIVDARKFRGTSIESREFANETFDALAARRGKHVSISLIVGDDATGRFTLNKIVKDSAGKGKYYGIFTTYEEAESWILSREA